MQGYTKLFGSILASTIWREPDTTRLVWITMLALSNKHGVVEASVPGLAALSRVSEPAARMALATLSAPDLDSRSQLEDGRRIVAVDGGWLLVTHAKYRAKMNRDLRRNYLAVKQQECRARRKAREAVNTNVNSQPLSTTVNPVNLPDKRKKKIRSKKNQKLLSEQAPTSIEQEFSGCKQDEASNIASPTTIQQSATATSNPHAKNVASELLDFVNETAGTHFRPVVANLRMIQARLQEYDHWTLAAVVRRQWAHWHADEKMRPYFRPATLFNREKCAQYVGQLTTEDDRWIAAHAEGAHVPVS